jgi:hypothetical protein
VYPLSLLERDADAEVEHISDDGMKGADENICDDDDLQAQQADSDDKYVNLLELDDEINDNDGSGEDNEQRQQDENSTDGSEYELDDGLDSAGDTGYITDSTVECLSIVAIKSAPQQ